MLELQVQEVVGGRKKLHKSELYKKFHQMMTNRKMLGRLVLKMMIDIEVATI